MYRECEQKSVNSVFPTAESLKRKTAVLTSVRTYHTIWVLSSFLSLSKKGTTSDFVDKDELKLKNIIGSEVDRYTILLKEAGNTYKSIDPKFKK